MPLLYLIGLILVMISLWMWLTKSDESSVISNRLFLFSSLIGWIMISICDVSSNKMFFVFLESIVIFGNMLMIRQTYDEME